MKAFKLLLVTGLCAFSSLTLAQDKLRIGVEPAYPPFEYKLPSGQLGGFDIDVGNEICKRLNMECVWLEQPFDSLIPGLQARKFDLIHSAVTVNEARKKVVDFTDSIYSIPSQVVAPKGSTIDGTVASMKGHKIGVLQGSAQETYARKTWAKEGVKIVSYPDQIQTFTDLGAGRIDGALIEKPNATAGFLKTEKGKNYQFVGQPLGRGSILNNEIAIVLRKDSTELKDKINAVIKQMQNDGTLEKLAQKNFQDGEVTLLK